MKCLTFTHRSSSIDAAKQSPWLLRCLVTWRQNLVALLAIRRNSRLDVSATLLESGLRFEHLPTR
jgi:hypothetical protein